jgi:dihydroneopterin aldolase
MIDPPRLAARGMRHVFLRDMVLPASIGIYPHEHAARQRIRINIDLGVPEDGGHAAGLSRAGVGRDDLGRVVDYEAVARAVRNLVAAGHVMLVETLAERLAEICLLDRRVEVARVRVEKLDVFDDVGSAGVEIERRRSTCPLAPMDTQ